MESGEVKPKGKKIFAFRHFFRRALERHGLMIDRDEIRRIIWQIKSMSAEFLRWTDDENFRTFYRVRIYGKPYIVLYDVVLDCLITIYHNSWMKFRNGEWGPSNYHTQKRVQWKNRMRRLHGKDWNENE
jgi:hypothetical protein